MADDKPWIEGNPYTGPLLISALLRGWPLRAFRHRMPELEETAWGTIAKRVAGANGNGADKLVAAFRGIQAPGKDEDETRRGMLGTIAKMDPLVDDWLQTDPEIVRLLGLPSVSFADVADMLHATSWLWEGWIPKGNVSMLVGRPGVGKSMALAWFATKLLAGGTMPDGAEIEPMGGNIMWIDTEGTQALTLERLTRMGADLSRFEWPIDPGKRSDPFPMIDLAEKKWIDIIADLAIVKRPASIIVDSLRGSFRGSEKESERMQEVLGAAAAIARDVCCGHVFSHHLRKLMPGENSEVTLDDVRGSGAIVAMARVVVAIDQPDRESKALRLRALKSNLAAFPKPLGLEVGERIEWTDKVPEAPRRETTVDKAREFLITRLVKGPVSSIELFEEAQAMGISKKSLFRARESARVTTVKMEDGKWHWALRPDRDEERFP